MEDNSKHIEDIKKNVRRIRRSGTSAQIFGWALLLLTSAAVWLAQTSTQAYIILAVGVVFGLIFIFTGKYIKVGKGRFTKPLLMINGLLSLPFCILILPLYVCVQSFNNYSRFKELPENVQELYIKPKKLRIAWWEIILLVLAVLGCVASTYMRTKNIHNTSQTNNNAQASAQPQVSTAKSHFTISFPATVGATTLTKKISDQPVSYVLYNSGGSKPAEIFSVYAYKFPASTHYATLPAAQLAKVVHASLLSTVSDLKGKVISTNPTTFMDYAAEDGSFTAQTIGGSSTGYIKVFFVGNYQYAIVTVGANSGDFSSFANSFQYKN